MTIAKITYSGATPGADSNSYTLFDQSAVSGAPLNQHDVYRLVLNNSASGTLKIYYKTSPTATPVLAKSIPVAAAATNDVNRFEYRIVSFKYIKVVWANGGSAQTTFDVLQSLSDAFSLVPVHSETDARVKCPISSATTNFAAQIGTSSVAYAVPSAWVGRRIAITCRGASNANATAWILFGTSSGVTVAKAAFVTGSPPAWTGDATIGKPLFSGSTTDYFVDPNMTHFAIQADTANTEITILPSDYAVGEV